MAQTRRLSAMRKRRAPVFARRLVLMVKVPAVGRTKTRLAREAGAVNAAAFYRHTVAAVLGRLEAARDWRTILCIAPDSATGSRTWPERCARRAQGHGDLGERMQRVMDRLPPGPVVIVGSDVPGIRADHVREAVTTWFSVRRRTAAIGSSV
jgi:glycosyltransferase A (GT-A) superfamily protein (DUF2064 family)